MMMEPEEGDENRCRFVVLQEEEDDDNNDCDLDDEQLFQFTQAYSSQYDFGDDDDDDYEGNDHDCDPDAPKPAIIDFSQTEANYDDDGYSGHEKTPHKKQRLSTVPEVIRDTPDKYFLDVGGECRIFKIGEVFHKDKPTVGNDLPNVVFKIERLYKDSMKKKAQCKVYMLARNTFMGKQDEFEQTNGKYVFKKMGEMVNLASLKTRVDNKEVLDEIDKTKVFIDPPSKDTKGPGWSVAYGFIKISEEKATYVDFPIFVDLYAGAGGVSHGFIQAGFRLTHAVDHDPMAASTLELNHHDCEVFTEDVETYAARCRSSNRSFPFEKAPDHIHGSSPCQDFSTKNRKGGKDSKRNDQSLVWARCVIVERANTGSYENVTGMIQEKHLHYLRTMINMFLMAKCQIRIGVINCEDYGDPQSRKRVIVLVSRTPCPLPDLPQQTHGTPDVPVVTAKDAIGDLESVEPRTEPGMTALPGKNLLVKHHHYNPAKPPSREDCLDADKPASTILCAKEVKHYSIDRNITNLERARLFNFPDHWKFCGRPTDIMKQIGNAVPVKTSTAIGKAIIEGCYEAVPQNFFESSEEQSISTIPPLPTRRTFRDNNPRRVTNSFL